MIFYLTLFIIFIALYKWAELRESKWLLFFAILVPSLFEGLRDDIVGQDMLGYGSQWFDYMDETECIWDMFSFAQTPEYAYHLIIYLSKLILPDIHLYMTICALIKMSMVTLFAYRMRYQISTVLFMFSYYCFFYVTSFSMMRQGVAVAICIYSLYYFYNENILKFLICVLVSYLFHNSAILMLLLIPLYLMRNFKYKYAVILGSILLIITSVEILFEYVLLLPIFKSEMMDLYMDSGVPSAKTNILISLAFIAYAIYLRGFGEDDSNEKSYIILVTSAMTLMFLVLSSYIEVAFRMSYYMFITSVLFVLMAIYENERLRPSFFIVFLSLFALHFYIESKHGLYGALDYSSDILGITFI